MSDDEYELAPIDEAAEAQRKRIREVPLPPYSEPAPEEVPPRYQFSILSMMLATIVVAIVTGLCQWISPNVVAGSIGLLTCFAILFIALSGKANPKLQIACLFLGLVYVIFSIVAAIRL